MGLNCIPLPNTATGGAVGGASNLVTVGSLTYVSATGVLNQATSLVVSGAGTTAEALTVYNSIASGVTKLTVKAGAGQSSTNLFEVQSNAGTVLSGFAPGGDLFFTSSTSSSDVRISRVAVGTATAMAAILRGDAGDYGRLYLKSMQAQATTGIAGLIGWGTTPGTYTTALSEISAGIVGVGTGAAGSTAGQLRATSVATVALTVATLPATPIAGQRAFVTDSNAASYTAGIGAIVAAGGTTACPVVYDGTNWRIG